MNQLTNRAGRGLLTAAAALALLTTSCGGEGGRQYAIPDEACDVNLNQKLLEPLMPDGEKLFIHDSSLIHTGTSTTGKCDLTVDRTDVVTIMVYQTDRVEDPMTSSASRFIDRKAITDLPYAGKGAVGDVLAMVSTGCSGKSPALVVEVSTPLEHDDENSQHRRHLRDFTVDLVPQVQKAMQCRT